MEEQNDKFTFSIFQKQHADQITELQVKMAKQIQNQDLDKDLVRQAINWLKNNPSIGFFLLKIKNDTPIASMQITFQNQERWWFESVYVVESQRRKGHFKSLFNQICKIAKQKGCKTLLNYVINVNQQTINLYKSLGMKQNHEYFYCFQFQEHSKKLKSAQDLCSQNSFTIKEEYQEKNETKDFRQLLKKQANGKNKQILIYQCSKLVAKVTFFTQFSEWRFGLIYYVDSLAISTSLQEEQLKKLTNTLFAYFSSLTEIKVVRIRYIFTEKTRLIFLLLPGGYIQDYEVMEIKLQFYLFRKQHKFLSQKSPLNIFFYFNFQFFVMIKYKSLYKQFRIKMQYLKGNIDIQLLGLGIGIIAVGRCLYIYIDKQQRNQQETRFTQKAKIYEMKDFVKYQKQLKRYSKPKIQINQQQSRLIPKIDEMRYLIKSVSTKILTIEKIQTYSNQVHLGSPSINSILEKYKAEKKSQSSSQNLVDTFLNEYDKEFNLNTNQSQGFVNDILFNGKILTDKIKASSKYSSQELDKKTSWISKLIKKIGSFFKIDRFWYHCAYYLEKLLYFVLPKRFVKKCTAGNQRFQFFNGILFGSLTTQFSFLQDTYFLLKVKVKNGRICSEIIADDKAMIIQHYKKQKLTNNIIILGASFIMALFLLEFLKLLRKRFKPFFMNLQSKNYSYLNPKGISDDKLCHICYVNCRNTIFYGCRHALVCLSCYEHLSQQKCIVCNIPLEHTQIIVSRQAKKIGQQI